VTYLVSGGGGASPVPEERTPDDQYQSEEFPNFHYVKFEVDGDSVHGTMIRLNRNTAPANLWEARDHLEDRCTKPR